MTSVKKYLLFVFFALNVNVVSANSIPKEVAAACGVRSCDVILKKMQKFAKNGSPHAQAVLALFYRGGYGTEIDNERSIKYMKRAAKSRLAIAQYDLGILYKLGHMVDKDQAESDLWLNRSAEAGYYRAIELLRSENKISQEDKIAFQRETSSPIIEEGEELMIITKKKYTLSDLVDYLNSLGYGRNSHTGSRIRGKGCGKGASNCATWNVNSPLGQANFNAMISKINAIQTGRGVTR